MEPFHYSFSFTNATIMVITSGGISKNAEQSYRHSVVTGGD